MKKVLLFLANGFEVLEASAFMDVMGWNQVEGVGSTKLYTCGLNKKITSSFNHKFLVDYTIDKIDVHTFDALAVPGGFEEYNYYTDVFDERFLNLIRAFNNQGKVIASICVAALPIGKSGVLKDKKATTYKSKKRRDTLKSFGVNVIDKPIVKTDNIITSKGPSTAIDVALMLLELLTSKTNADNIRFLMGFERP